MPLPTLSHAMPVESLGAGMYSLVSPISSLKQQRGLVEPEDQRSQDIHSRLMSKFSCSAESQMHGIHSDGMVHSEPRGQNPAQEAPQALPVSVPKGELKGFHHSQAGQGVGEREMNIKTAHMLISQKDHPSGCSTYLPHPPSCGLTSVPTGAWSYLPFTWGKSLINTQPLPFS